MKRADQPGLFGHGRLPPEGLRYWPGVLSADEQRELVRRIEALPLRPFEFHGFTGNRRVVSFGWGYDFNEGDLLKADDMPPFLLPLRERAAALAGLPASAFQHALVTEYAPGVAIGWHRDKAVFDEVVGFSLLSPCNLRFRRARPGTRGAWERVTILAEPRSAYLLTGPARTEWEHSIPPVDALRYSITFRNFRAG